MHKNKDMHETNEFQHLTEAGATLRSLEAARCEALLSGDRARLGGLLHPGLVHVHAKGQVDTRESYLAGGGFKVDYQRVERAGLEVRVLGDAALMTGRQLLEAVRKESGERIRIDSFVTQVWVRAGGSWKLLAFQTTPSEFAVSAAA